MAEVITKETVEVAEKPVEAAAPAPLPKREELKDKGWSAKELDAAEKRGMVAKPEEKKEEPKATAKPEEKAPEVTPKSEEKKPEPARRGTPLDDVVLTPEQEARLAELFPAGDKIRAFYFRAKNERSARQRAEAERDAERKARQELEEKLKAKPKEDVPEDENPDNKPLTVADLKRLRDEEAKANKERLKKDTERAHRVSSAQVEQEEYARSIIPDFDDTVKLAGEVMQNLDALLPEKWQQAKALRLIRELQVTAANADQLGLDDYNAAMIAVEIGRLHPKYGKPAEKVEEKPGAKTDPKANGGRTPEEMERMRKNAEQRPSSASVPGGGGKRTVSVDEVTLADLNSMNASERIAFRQKHPKRYTDLMRG